MSKPFVINRLIGNDGKYLKIKKNLNDLFCASSAGLFNLSADDEVELTLVEIRVNMHPYKDNNIEVHCHIKFSNNDCKVLILYDYLNEYIAGIRALTLMMEHYQRTQNKETLRNKINRYARLVELNFCEEVRFSD